MGWTYLILGAVVVLFVWNRLPVELVALGAALALAATGVLEVDQALAGFGDPAVILIASLFVVSEALDATGVTTWAGRLLAGRSGGSRSRLLVLLMLLVALLTALISVNGAVASLLPMTVIVAVTTGTAPSKLLMPLAFGAHAGSMLALTGTPVNVIASDAAADAGVGRFAFFEFTLVGVPLVAGTILVMLVVGRRVLPDRVPSSLTPDLSAHARTLGQQYFADHRVARLLVLPDSACVGRSSEQLGAQLAADGVDVVGVQVGGRGSPTTSPSLAAGDVVILRTGPESVAELASACGFALDAAPFTHDPSGALLDRELGVAEVVIPPRSGMVGARVFPGMVTDSGDLVVLAVQRKGEDRGARETRLAVGDTLLLQGEWSRLDHHVGVDPDVVAVDAPELVRRHAVPLGARSTPAILVLVAMVVLLATGIVPAAVAGLLAAASMVLVGALTVEQAYRGISWTTVVLVAAMIPMSTAMTESGAAEHAANALVDLVGGSSPYVLLLGLFVLTVTLGQLVSNMATALIVIPVAVSAAGELGVSIRPVLMCVTVSAAAALLTPVATPANLMVMDPAGYRFGDYWKVGLPVLGVYLLVAVGLVPVIWSF